MATEGTKQDFQRNSFSPCSLRLQKRGSASKPSLHNLLAAPTVSYSHFSATLHGAEAAILRWRNVNLCLKRNSAKGVAAQSHDGMTPGSGGPSRLAVMVAF